MSRLHLVEIEDLRACPAVIRDGGVDFLRATQTWIDQTRPVVPLLAGLLERTGSKRLVDLCSGGGGPLDRIVGQLREAGHDVKVWMTDLFPNRPAFERAREASQGRVDFVPEPVDATDVPSELDGVRTVFNGFHHFRPELARAVLQDAIAKRQPIAIFELVARRPLALLGIPVAALTSFFVVPFLRPFRWGRVVFTWLLPAIPLMVLWDGVVSCLRVYSPDELNALLRELDVDDYRFEAGTLPNPASPVPITYLIGEPLPRP